MAHPQLHNRTPFLVEPLFLADAEARPVLVPICKGTFDIADSGQATPSETQPPLLHAGAYYGDPTTTSPRFEPEVAFEKTRIDVVLHGTATPSGAGVREMDVRLRLGPIDHGCKVVGDRVAQKRWSGWRYSPPEPIERVPLTWERTFGGWDRSSADEERHSCDPRNPVGAGFVSRRGRPVEGSPAPNLVPLRQAPPRPGGKGVPVGFGFTAPHWEPRRSFAGTFDDAWQRDRAPAFPSDFDPLYFQGAAPGLVFRGPLHGGEAVRVDGVHERGTWEFQLPDLPALRFTAIGRRGSDVTLAGKVDTVVIDADARTLTVTWRARTHDAADPNDLAELVADHPGL